MSSPPRRNSTYIIFISDTYAWYYIVHSAPQTRWAVSLQPFPPSAPRSPRALCPLPPPHRTEHQGLPTTRSPVATCPSAGRAPHDALSCRDMAPVAPLPARPEPAPRPSEPSEPPGPVPLLPRPRRCRSAVPASAAAAPQHPPAGPRLPAAPRRRGHPKNPQIHPQISPGGT